MKNRFKGYLPVIILALAVVTMADGVNGIFNTVNSASGYKVGGAAGSVGQALCSDGTFFNTACPIPSAPAFTATSGYQTLSSGLILAWATGTGVSGDSVQTVTLPTTFPTACLTAWTVNYDPSETTNITKNWAFVSCSTTGVVVKLQRRGDEGSFVATPKVFVLGY